MKLSVAKRCSTASEKLFPACLRAQLAREKSNIGTNYYLKYCRGEKQKPDTRLRSDRTRTKARIILRHRDILKALDESGRQCHVDYRPFTDKRA